MYKAIIVIFSSAILLTGCGGTNNLTPNNMVPGASPGINNLAPNNIVPETDRGVNPLQNGIDMTNQGINDGKNYIEDNLRNGTERIKDDLDGNAR